MDTVLFLCTGNYYRSRFAEEIFNFLSIGKGLPWHADSRGLRQNMNTSPNVGSMAPDAIAQLRKLGITPVMSSRDPLSVCVRDFQSASKVIALCESEHRPMMAELFPMFEKDIEYWDVDDFPKLDSQTGMNRIKDRVSQLISQLSLIQQHEASFSEH